MTQRIAETFARCRRENRAALIFYLTSGFPDEATTRAILPVLTQSGADLVELGIPFSDPIADGPTIQKASTRALEAGMTLDRTLDILRDFRGGDDHTPVILFGAVNPYLVRGAEGMAREAREAGADGILAADLPVEECAEFRAACADSGLALVLLAAPTTPTARIERIASQATGFLYAISLKGITGARAGVGPEVVEYLERVKTATGDLPVAVGFGISKPEHAAALAPHADGVVVGSALVNLVDAETAAGRDPVPAVRDFVRAMAEAVRFRPGA